MLGGAGFIGSHTAEQLLNEGAAEVVVYDNFSRGKQENLEHVLKDRRARVFDVGGDILHVDTLSAALKEADGVFHFAALWLLQCREYPVSAFEVNVRGTFNVMDACVKSGVKRLIYSSSASVYGEALHEPMGEDHPLNNRNFYGATKIAGEAMLRAYHQQYGLDYVGLRYMNVYGPRQDYKGAYVSVIMKMLDALEAGRNPVIVGDGSESLDFVSVRDCASANICAMKAQTTDAFYNVGTGVKTTLRDLAELLMELTAVHAPIDFVPRSDASIVRNRIGDTAKAVREIGFDAKVQLRDGLRDLIRWRHHHASRHGAR